MQPQIVEALSTVFDPEIPVNIYELGLIYEIAVDADDVVGVRMTLTSPNCPAAQSLPVDVVNKLKQLSGVTDAHVDIVWGPALGQRPDVGRRETATRNVLNVSRADIARP